MAPGYEVSSDGLVRSRRGELRAHLRNGYLSVRTFVDGGHRNLPVHIAVARAFLGPRPPGLDINHIDGVKTNNVPRNLEYVTRGENLAHALRLGLRRSPRGESSGHAKVTEQDVHAIRLLGRTGRTRKSIAAEFGLGANTVSKILNRETWKHVD